MGPSDFIHLSEHVHVVQKTLLPTNQAVLLGLVPFAIIVLHAIWQLVRYCYYCSTADTHSSLSRFDQRIHRCHPSSFIGFLSLAQPFIMAMTQLIFFLNVAKRCVDYDYAAAGASAKDIPSVRRCLHFHHAWSLYDRYSWSER